MVFSSKTSPKGAERFFMFITSMEELKGAAIKLQDGMQTYWPQFARYETLDLNKLKGTSIH